MAERAWMPMYWGDYVKDTLHLTVEEHGAYLLLIGAYWVNGKPLPDDDRQLARITRCSDFRWKKLRNSLATFFEISNGLWTHKRLEKELLKSSERSAKARASAQQRARAITITVREEESLPPTTPHEPTAHSECRPPGGEAKANGYAKSKAKPLGSLMSEDWKPSAEAVRFCRMDLGCPSDVLNATYQRFKDWGLSVTGPKARKRDWDRAFINAVRSDLREIREREARERRWAEQRGRATH